MMKLLVCGGLGFIGSAFIRNHIANFPQDKIINIDNLSIGSNPLNLSEIEKVENYNFIKEDIKNFNHLQEVAKDVDIIINFAAETHVDRSISNPKPFVDTNIFGTFSLLELSRKHEKTFVHVSTDEVYGSADEKSFSEKDPMHPSNPYSATKAAADHLVLAYHKTYGINCIVTRCTNNFGPYQFPEKLIPKTIIRASKDLKIPLYGGGNQIRSWIYVDDHVKAIEILLSEGKFGEIYNITSWNELTNKKIVEKILNLMEKPTNIIEEVGDRPGHDKKYSIDASKILKTTTWKPKFDLDVALKLTVDWYNQNKTWWEPLINEKTLHPQPWTLDWSS